MAANNFEQIIDEIQQMLTNAHQARQQSLFGGASGSSQEATGCTEEQIREIETAANVNLPGCYRAYLRKMGGGTNRLFRGEDDYYYPNLISAQGILSDWRFADQDFRLPNDVFVFLMHHGHLFYYFHTENVGDDPPVYCVPDLDYNPEKVSDSTSEFFLEWAKTRASLMTPETRLKYLNKLQNQRNQQTGDENHAPE